MAHPLAEHKEYNTRQQRVGRILGHKRGGSAHSDEAADRKLISKMLAEHERKEMAVEGNLRHLGHKSKGRLDRKGRAEGGRTPKPDITPLKIDTSPAKPDWMKGLSEKEVSSILGSTHRDPETGIRGHKKGGKVGKYARGGRTKKAHTKINILVAPRGGHSVTGAPGPQGASPLPPTALGAGPSRPPLPPPGAGGLPPGIGGPQPLPGGPPMRSGGRTKGKYARGGKVHMTAGADSGPGRLEKIRAYGLSPKKAG